MPTIRFGEQIVSSSDLCAGCAVATASGCVFLEAMYILQIDLEGDGTVQYCNGFVLPEDVPVAECYDELFDDGDEL